MYLSKGLQKQKEEWEKPTSPIPINARMISKNGSPILAATGVKTVATDHQTTPKPNTGFPPNLSAHMPPTIYARKFEKYN